MARPLRIKPGAVYHVTSRGNAPQVLSLLAHVVERYGWLCNAYCLIDNHYHLLFETPQPAKEKGTA